MTLPLLLVLPGERPLSWNQFYTGRHWAVRKGAKDRVHQLVRAELPRVVVDGEGFPVPWVVRITVTAYCAGPLLDADNVCTKLYVDALKGWVIEDDDPTHVECVVPVVRRGSPRVEILVELA
jgi:hypothetical protein